MFASKHPLEDGTLVIEIPRDELLDLHGTLLMDFRNRGPAARRDELMSIIEAAYAGGSLERFERPVETHSVAAPIERVDPYEPGESARLYYERHGRP